MTSEFTERLIADIRDGDAPISVQGRALLDLADQRDALLEIAHLFLAELHLSMAITGPEADKVADLEAKVEAAIAKARPADGEQSGT